MTITSPYSVALTQFTSGDLGGATVGAGLTRYWRLIPDYNNSPLQAASANAEVYLGVNGLIRKVWFHITANTSTARLWLYAGGFGLMLVNGLSSTGYVEYGADLATSEDSPVFLTIENTGAGNITLDMAGILVKPTSEG